MFLGHKVFRKIRQIFEPQSLTGSTYQSGSVRNSIRLESQIKKIFFEGTVLRVCYLLQFRTDLKTFFEELLAMVSDMLCLDMSTNWSNSYDVSAQKSYNY